jgi:inosine-uridine nucleoside N-ribohydrolase
MNEFQPWDLLVDDQGNFLIAMDRESLCLPLQPPFLDPEKTEFRNVRKLCSLPDARLISKAFELVFMGAARPPNFPDFNVRFDPEAARIVLGAQWPSITSVGDVTYQITLQQADLDKISGAHTPIGDFVVQYSGCDVSKAHLWDEICAAVLIDPTLVKETDDEYIDVVVDHQKDYSAIRLSPSNAMIEDQSKVRIVDKIDVDRFKSEFVDSMVGLSKVPPMKIPK